MAQSRKRGGEPSRDVPELVARLLGASASFVRLFDERELGLTRGVRELQGAADVLQQALQDLGGAGGAGAGAEAGEEAGAESGFFSRLTCGYKFFTDQGFVGMNPFLQAQAGAGRLGQAVGNVSELGRGLAALVEPLRLQLEQVRTACEHLEARLAEAPAKRSAAGLQLQDAVLGRVSVLGGLSARALQVVSAAEAETRARDGRVQHLPLRPQAEQLLPSVQLSVQLGQTLVSEFGRVRTEASALIQLSQVWDQGQ